MYQLIAYGYNGDFAFAMDFDTEDEALDYARTIERKDYDLEIEAPNGEISYL